MLHNWKKIYVYVTSFKIFVKCYPLVWTWNADRKRNLKSTGDHRTGKIKKYIILWKSSEFSAYVLAFTIRILNVTLSFLVNNILRTVKNYIFLQDYL